MVTQPAGAPPRLRDHPPVAGSVEPVLALLGLTRGSRVPHGRALGHPPPALHGEDEELRGVVLGLPEPVGDVVEHADPHGPVAVGGVGEIGVADRAEHPGEDPDTSLAHVTVSNITVRYTIKTTTPLNVGSFVKTFRVVNTANVPCNGRWPCSPDGKWKAALGSATLEAPGGNVFSKARVSCIAGPCPFTNIRSDRFSGGGRTVSVAVLDWSDTTTFLFEAELFREMISDSVRVSYPVTFGQTVHFTVPADAEGVCIEADLDRDHIVFPLGPEPRLSWASCTALVNPDRTKLYRCELKPGYGLK